MKILKFLAMMLIGITTLFSFTACGGDDDDKEPSTSPTAPVENTVTLVGTWRCVDKNGDSAVLTLNANHTGKISVSIDPSRATVNLVEHFNWNNTDDASGNHWLEVIHTSGDEWFDSPNMIYILAGNTLQLDGFVYTRI